MLHSVAKHTSLIGSKMRRRCVRGIALYSLRILQQLRQRNKRGESTQEAKQEIQVQKKIHDDDKEGLN